MVMPFGKYKDYPLSSIPEDYLEWMIEEMDHLRPSLRREVVEELSRREAARHPPPPPPPSRLGKKCPDVSIAEEMIGSGLRSLAKRYHPDQGGNTEKMVLVNAVADWLRAQIRALPL